MTPPESPREREGAGSQQGQEGLMATDITQAEKQRDQGRLEREREEVQLTL